MLSFLFVLHISIPKICWLLPRGVESVCMVYNLILICKQNMLALAFILFKINLHFNNCRIAHLYIQHIYRSYIQWS